MSKYFTKEKGLYCDISFDKDNTLKIYKYSELSGEQVFKVSKENAYLIALEILTQLSGEIIKEGE